jgi:hypothetical protein
MIASLDTVVMATELVMVARSRTIDDCWKLDNDGVEDDS